MMLFKKLKRSILNFILAERLSSDCFKYPFSGDMCLEKELKKIISERNIDYVIETGTYVGNTTKAFRSMAPKVVSIEIKLPLYIISRFFLFGLNNIKLYHGESSKVLRRILPKLSKKTNSMLVYLDAHWYENPLIGELKAISESKIKPVIVIHDFRVPGHPELGFDTYPKQGVIYELSYIRDSLDEIYGRGGYSYRFNSKSEGAKRGCIFIFPVDS